MYVAANNEPILRQQAPDLVGLGRPLPNQFAANPMDRLQVLLGNRLDGDKTHRWSAYRFTNGLGIIGIFLVALYIRLH